MASNEVKGYDATGVQCDDDQSLGLQDHGKLPICDDYNSSLPRFKEGPARYFPKNNDDTAPNSSAAHAKVVETLCKPLSRKVHIGVMQSERPVDKLITPAIPDRPETKPNVTPVRHHHYDQLQDDTPPLLQL